MIDDEPTPLEDFSKDLGSTRYLSQKEIKR
jgi:hypothetical protein